MKRVSLNKTRTIRFRVGRCLLIATTISLMSASVSVASLSPGKGMFTWDDNTGQSDPDKPLDVYYYRPPTVTPTTPVWFIMHGTDRNADDYRDYFADEAADQGAIVIAPQFTTTDWPGSRSYNLGNISVSESNLTPKPVQEWSFSKIEPLFDYLKNSLEPTLNVPEYFMFGHSAGAQFVHRFLEWTPEARVKQAISANAGWYTMAQYADASYPFSWPYSLSNVPDFYPATGNIDAFPEELLESFLARKMVVLLGEEDTLITNSLRQTLEANAQGANRFERGNFFFNEAQTEALNRNVSFGWDLQTVPGVGHDANQMATPAAEIFRLANLSPADFDQNGLVNQDDLLKWSSDFGVNGGSDADGDGDSDGRDFLIWQREFDGGPVNLGSLSVVPEPSIAAHLAAMLVVLNIGWRRPSGRGVGKTG